MSALDTESSRILDSRIKNAKVMGALQQLKTAINSPAPGSRVVMNAVAPDSQELFIFSTQGIVSVNVIFYSSTACFSEHSGRQPASSAILTLPRTSEGLAWFEDCWKSLEDTPRQNFEKQTEVHSSPILDRLDALRLALPPERLALLLRIRAFRKKAGKLDFTINELLREVREESA